MSLQQPLRTPLQHSATQLFRRFSGCRRTPTDCDLARHEKRLFSSVGPLTQAQAHTGVRNFSHCPGKSRLTNPATLAEVARQFFSTCSQCFKHGGLIAQLRNKCRSINYQSRYSAINYHLQRSQAMKLHTFWLINLHYLTQVERACCSSSQASALSTVGNWLKLTDLMVLRYSEVPKSACCCPPFLLHGRYNHFPQLSSMLRNSNRLLKHQLVIFGLFPTLNSLIKHKENPTHKNSDNTANRLNPGRSIGATPSPRPYPAPQQHHKGRDQYAAQKMTRTQLDCDFLLKHGHPLAISDKRSMQTPRQMVQGETA